jgi:peptide/nickel transport system permease protein
MMHCPDDKTGAGQFNLGSYCNPKLDELTAKIGSETDQAKRNEMIKEAFQIHIDDVGHLPLHQQMLAWGVSKKVQLVQLADNFMPFKWITSSRDAPGVRAVGGFQAQSARGARQSSAASYQFMSNIVARWLDSDVGYSFRNSPMAILAAVIAFVCIFCSVFAGWVSPHNPFDLTTLELSDARLPPAWYPDGKSTYLLGTDDQGRDILSALIYGRASRSWWAWCRSCCRCSQAWASACWRASRAAGSTPSDAPVRRDAVVSGHPGGAADRRRRAGAVSQRARVGGLRRADHRHLADRLGAVRAHRARLHLVERNKEYVQAARVTGVSSWRIMRATCCPTSWGRCWCWPPSRWPRPSSPRPRCPSWAWACRPPRPRWAR